MGTTTIDSTRAAAKLTCSRQWVCALCKARELVATQDSEGRWRIDAASVDAYSARVRAARHQPLDEREQRERKRLQDEHAANHRARVAEQTEARQERRDERRRTRRALERIAKALEGRAS